MTNTGTPKGTPETITQPRVHLMAKSVRQFRRTIPTGVSYIYNALAFSTLLSSQETDAHLWRNLRSPPGQPLNLTLEFLSCQLRFWKLSRRLRSGTAVSPDTKTEPPSAWWALRAHTRPSEVDSLVAPRVPVRLPAFRPPRGMMNFTTSGHCRQIGVGTHVQTSSNPFLARQPHFVTCGLPQALRPHTSHTRGP
jgi:hypothetical protein